MGTGTRPIAVVEILTVWPHHRLVGYAVSVLPAGCLRSEEGSERVSVRLRRLLPIGSDRTPTLAETFFVGVAVLRDEGSDALRVADREPEASRRAVVKDIHCKPIESDDFGEAVDHACNIVECVAKVFSRRHVGLTEPWKVRRDHKKSVGEQRDQITEHVARARETVQQ